MGSGARDESRAHRVTNQRLRSFWAVLACAAATTTVAAAWVVYRIPRRAVPPAAVAVSPPTRAPWKMPQVSAPTAEDEEGRTVALARSAPGRLPQSSSGASAPPTAMARPYHAPSGQTSQPQPVRSASHLTALPPDHAHRHDPNRSSASSSQAAARPQPAPAQAAERTSQSLTPDGHAAQGRVSAPGAEGEGAGSSGTGSGGGSAQATGEGDRGAGASSPVVRPTADPAQLVPPRVITSAGTAYPVEAFRLTVKRQDLGAGLTIEGAEGSVRVRAMVRADGTANAVEVMTSSGSAVLDRAALEAVRGWSFAPATRNGVPLDAYATFTIRYVVR